MEVLDETVVENEVIKVITAICSKLKIEVTVNSEFVPGEFIQSPVLLTFMPIIATAVNIEIPNSIYIFSDNHYTQLSIKETTKKILKIAKDGK